MATPSPPITEPSCAGRLLDLVRRLIDYGKDLATRLQQRGTVTDLAAATLPFGTSDIALILARITCGLQRANALEARLVRSATRLDAAPRPPSAPAVTPRAPSARRPAAPPAPSHLAQLPTPEQIAAEVRRRPIGAVLADICRDLGIMPSHALWRDLRLLIMRHGGNLARLVKDRLQQAFPLPVVAVAMPASRAPFRQPPSPVGAGPP